MGPQLGGLAMVISAMEMPEMDGYTFTTEVRADERLKHLYIVLHTSMSGVFNQTMVDKVGANKFIAKFDPDVLGQAVIDAMKLPLAETCRGNSGKMPSYLPLVPLLSS